MAANNQDLGKMAQRGKFRSDLLFNLRFLITEIPLLRIHPDDIKELVLYHTAKLCECYGMRTKGFSTEFYNALTGYHWSGNVRELYNTLERALQACQISDLSRSLLYELLKKHKLSKNN